MDKTISYLGNELFYKSIGKGNPVVLIHGFGEDGTIWERQENALKDHFRLIIPDIPGSGKSQAIGINTSIEDYAESMKAVLDAESIASATFIGHSMGGYIALAFADKYPDCMDRLGLFHSTAYPDNEEKKSARRKGIEFIRQYGALPFLQQSIPALFSEYFKNKWPQIVQELIDRYANFNPQSLVSYYEAMIRRPDRTHILKKFQKPVLFIMGEEDKSVPIEHMLEQSHMPQLSYIHILENNAHMGMFENTEQSSLMLENFLDQVF